MSLTVSPGAASTQSAKGMMPRMPAQLKPQAAAGVVGQGGALQHLAAGDAAAQLLPAQMVRIAAKAFGSIFQHFRFLISCKYL